MFDFESFCKYVAKKRIFTIPGIQHELEADYATVFHAVKALEESGRVRFIGGLEYETVKEQQSVEQEPEITFDDEEEYIREHRRALRRRYQVLIEGEKLEFLESDDPKVQALRICIEQSGISVFELALKMDIGEEEAQGYADWMVRLGYAVLDESGGVKYYVATMTEKRVNRLVGKRR